MWLHFDKAFAAFILVLAVHGAEPGCTFIPGVDTLWSRPSLRFVIVGEIHGTTEAPAIFADLVCSAHQTNRHIIVGIELRDQQALSMFMDQRPKTTVAKPLASADWKRHDGRTSTAMLELLEKLRSLKNDRVVSDVVAFSVARAGESAADGERRMASALLNAAKRHTGSLVIALTGNVHACKQELQEVGPYDLMASYLPRSETVSLVIADQGGEAWNCQNGACGPHPLGSSGGYNRGVTWASPHTCFDGVLATGLPATASAPAVH